MTFSLPSRLLLFLLTAGLLATAACDSGPTISETELAGVYTFEQFTFDPDASVLPDADVLDTLVAGATTLELVENNRFFLSYRYNGSPSNLAILGSFSIDGSRVRLKIGSSYDSFRRKLLLPSEIPLKILEDETVLEAAISMQNVDVSQFSPRYDGIGRVDGTLRLRLRRSTTP